MAGKQPTLRGYRVFPAFVIFQQSMRHLIVDETVVASDKKSVTSFFRETFAVGTVADLNMETLAVTVLKTICVGAIMGAFGVKGEVRLKSFCAVP